MSLSPAKHYYSRTSVEAWFRFLSQDWERHFTEQQLKKGRQIYLSNGIRELELSNEDAIVHCELNEKPYYSVITWDKQVPSIRSSSRMAERARSIAVAGIYQIEELIADQITDLALEEFADDMDADEALGEEVEEDTDSEVGRTRSRPMILTFSGSERGLSFKATWLNGDNSKESALDFASSSKRTPLTESESEDLIRLTSMARKAGFTLDKENQCFLMSDIGRFLPFLSHVLPKWKSHFTIVRETEVKRLMQGIQSIELEAHVEESKEEGEAGKFSIEWTYQAEGRKLTEKEATKLTKRLGQPIFLPEQGIVQLTDSQVDLLGKWVEFKKETNQRNLDKYMILSLFGEGEYTLKLSRNLVSWRNRLFSEPKLHASAFDFLRVYQGKGIDWMVHVLNEGCHCLLADEMGLGKTVQVLAVISLSKKRSKKPAVVFCPASVIPVWKSEISKFFPELTYFHFTGPKCMQQKTLEPFDVLLCSYTQLRRNVEILKELEYALCILDEAQVIKNPDTKVSRASFQINAEKRLAVTGTPIENHYKDIWSIFYFLMPGLLGNRTKFETTLEAAGEGFYERLKNQLAPFILRRTKEEVISELPEKNEMQLNCSMTELQRKEYSRILTEGLKKIGDEFEGGTVQKRSFSFFALLTRLRQVCCDPGLLPWMDSEPMKSAKIQLMVEKLADIFESGHKVVIFSQFVGLIERLKEVFDEEFPQLNLYTLTGKTVDREKPVKAFQTVQSPAVILVSLKAGGTGITLHAADYVFLMDPWWNPSVENQAIDRVHRLGQEKPVFVYRVITAGTIEERVQALQQEKRDMFKHLIEDLRDVSDFKEHMNTLTDLLSLQN